MREAWAVTGAIGAPARMSGEMPAGAAQIVSVGEVKYSTRALPARGLVLTAPNTSWPGSSVEPSAGVMMRAAMSNRESQASSPRASLCWAFRRA
jgi:hypothetical protein